MEKDPVCGMDVDEASAAATSEYNGQTYYFCAQSCKERFDQSPERYIKEANQPPVQAAQKAEGTGGVSRGKARRSGSCSPSPE